MILKIFGFDFHIYGLMLGLGILAGLESSLWLAKLRKIDKKVVDNLFWWVVGGGIIGARVYHVVDKWKEIYSLNPQSVFYLWNGGLGIWGAVIGGLVACYLSLLIYHRSFSLDLLDVVLFGVPLGQAVGRWGNFFNNEIVGKNGEPLFFFESALDLLLFFILFWVARRFKKSGVVAGIYLIGYGLIRFVLEPMRPESIVWKMAGIPTASLVSVIAALVGVCLISQKRS